MGWKTLGNDMDLAGKNVAARRVGRLTADGTQAALHGMPRGSHGSWPTVRDISGRWRKAFVLLGPFRAPKGLTCRRCR